MLYAFSLFDNLQNLKGKFVTRLSWKYLKPIIDSSRRWDGQSFQLSHSTRNQFHFLNVKFLSEVLFLTKYMQSFVIFPSD